MGSLFDYLDWRGDLRFTDTALGEVDGLILSLLSYIDFEGIVPSDYEKSVTLLDATRQYLRRHRGENAYLGVIVPPDIVSLAAKASKSRRFGDARLCGYVNRVDDGEQKQFCAMTFLLSDNTAFVAFRGTDDTLVGWKENFNMSFMDTVPAQQDAVSYLEEMATTLPHPFSIGGHSKGGNLAIFSAVRCKPNLKERLLTAFSYDGPGFSHGFCEGADYESIRPKLRTIVPDSSVVGMLLEHEETYEVVKSCATGLLQHNGFSWEVLGGKFIHLDTVTGESRLIDAALKNWLDSMSAEEREGFVDNIYETLTAVGAKTLTELNAEKLKLVKAWGSLDPKTRSVLIKCVSLLLRPGSRATKKAK